MHTHKHAWNDSAAATARGANANAGISARLFRSTQSSHFRTSNARTSLYPLPETPIPLNPLSPLPYILQNSSRTVASAVLLFRTDQQNRVHHCEEVVNSPLRSCRKIGGKAVVQQSPSRRARRTPSPRMSKVTVNEKRMVNEEQPNPAAAHHSITTAWCPDNTRSSAMVRS